MCLTHNSCKHIYVNIKLKIILRRWKQTWSVDITNHVQGVYINTGNKQIIAHIKQNKRDALMYNISPRYKSYLHKKYHNAKQLELRKICTVRYGTYILYEFCVHCSQWNAVHDTIKVILRLK